MYRRNAGGSRYKSDDLHICMCIAKYFNHLPSSHLCNKALDSLLEWVVYRRTVCLSHAVLGDYIIHAMHIEGL